MRSSKSRSRNKSNRQRSLGNVVNRVFDSSGPEGKVRGTPQQIIEKYLTLARDAQLSGDRVAEQSFFQHAEHYTRMLGEAQREMAERQGHQGGQREDEGGFHGGNGNGNGHGSHRENGQREHYGRDQNRDGQRDNPRDGQRDGGQGGHRDNQRQGEQGQREGGQREGSQRHEFRDQRPQREQAEPQPDQSAEPRAPRRAPRQEDARHDDARHEAPAQPEMDLGAPLEALPPALEHAPEAEGPVVTPESTDAAQPEGEAPAKAPRARRPRSAPATPRAPTTRNRRKPAADAGGDAEGGEAKAPAENGNEG